MVIFHSYVSLPEGRNIFGGENHQNQETQPSMDN